MDRLGMQIDPDGIPTRRYITDTAIMVKCCALLCAFGTYSENADCVCASPAHQLIFMEGAKPRFMSTNAIQAPTCPRSALACRAPCPRPSKETVPDALSFTMPRMAV